MSAADDALIVERCSFALPIPSLCTLCRRPTLLVGALIGSRAGHTAIVCEFCAEWLDDGELRDTAILARRNGFLRPLWLPAGHA